MPSARLRRRAVWGGALLLGLLLAAPQPAQAEAKPKGNPPSFDMAIGRVKAAIGDAQENNKDERRVEKALEQLLQALEAEREHQHHHRHSQEGTFGAGFDHATDSTEISTGSTGNATPVGVPALPSADPTGTSDPGSDSSGGSPGSAASPGPTGSPMAGGAGTSPISTAPSGPSKGNKSQNKQSQGKESQHSGHSPFAQGLRKVEREERERREERKERQLEHAFARGLAVLLKAEEHAVGTQSKPTVSANGQTASPANNGAKTASTTPSTSTSPTVGTSAKAPAQHVNAGHAEDHLHNKPFESPRKMALAPPTGNKKAPATHGPTGGMVGQRPMTAHAPAHAPTTSVNHISGLQHAGALAGNKSFGHK